jgi:nitroimidazol reductase NimA-like FMN-containing flavoprotein (pyridoxamine 5'-phosphate oxidase superfamily)
MSRAHHRIVELDAERCHTLIAGVGSGLGRVAFADGGDPNWPVVLPVNFVALDGAIYFRTFEGSKLYAALRRQRVAFEVDAIEPTWRSGWSVLALGRLDIVRDPDIAAAVDAVLTSWAAGGEQLVGMTVEDVSGREVFGPAS